MIANRWTLALCVLLSFPSALGRAQYDTEKLIRERAKTLATDRDVNDRVDAARFLGGLDKPEAGRAGNAGVEELISAAARMDAVKARAYAETHKSNPAVLALLKNASAK